MLLQSKTIDLLDKALDGAALRHVAIASNIANVDSPGYHRKAVAFEGQLKAALSREKGATLQPGELAMRVDPRVHGQRGHLALEGLGLAEPGAIREVPIQMNEVSDLYARNDGNGVDIESEMVRLGQNTQRYLALSNLQGKKFKGLKNIINGQAGQ